MYNLLFLVYFVHKTYGSINITVGNKVYSCEFSHNVGNIGRGNYQTPIGHPTYPPMTIPNEVSNTEQDVATEFHTSYATFNYDDYPTSGITFSPPTYATVSFQSTLQQIFF